MSDKNIRKAAVAGAFYPNDPATLSKMLAEFLLGREVPPVQLASTAFPNPCNPRTTVEMVFPDDLDKEGQVGILRIFDIRGALVTTLTGGHVANNRLAIQWDGTGRSGAVVPSGRYLYVVGVWQLVSKGAVTLVR